MRRFITFSLLALAAALTAAPPAEAQQRRRVIIQDDGVPIIRVRPRSFLDPGNVVEPGSLDRTTSGVAQVQSYLLFPPYGNQAGRFGGDVLPDPVTNGPYVGSRSPFDPVDFNGPINVHAR